jgi:hypothetical protein
MAINLRLQFLADRGQRLVSGDETYQVIATQLPGKSFRLASRGGVDACAGPAPGRRELGRDVPGDGREDRERRQERSCGPEHSTVCGVLGAEGA